MRKVTEQGLLIPNADPIFELGAQPIVCDVADASDNHDAYLYGRNS